MNTKYISEITIAKSLLNSLDINGYEPTKIETIETQGDTKKKLHVITFEYKIDDLSVFSGKKIHTKELLYLETWLK